MLYVVGDIQGCFDELMALLDKVAFDHSKDRLVSVGDLVARGPKSLEVLRFFMAHPESCKTVLGNHDLNLLAILCGHRKAKKSDKLDAILDAGDQDAISGYLRRQPLALWFEEQKLLVSHAGLPPEWQKEQVLAASSLVSQGLQNEGWQQLLLDMYGDEPSQWSPELTGTPLLRYIINSLTRMRFCRPDGSLELKCKACPADGISQGFIPWYQFHGPLPFTVAFGHWAALEGELTRSDIKALDTGCVWGNTLTLWCADNNFFYQQPAIS
ncbi:symmetrical bis(5'-nucleosyl)-tetraphosphatase [Gallaecimonas mangrovi]|uniref:symmetrical bis(5'-nucleosyl)-tetraphosphatase n=1 Tax=Gallaecimonas mangrovi TaxID=2291597 RepID=UPI000E20C21D|nr:symmetrical bis(5'-nucleosyl)-tetraphosphatase [Gallaecimonas mangrovi]